MLLQSTRNYSRFKLMKFTLPPVRNPRQIRFLMTVLVLLVCFTVQAEAAAIGGFLKSGACSSGRSEKARSSHACCGPGCRCDVQQDNAPDKPESAAIPPGQADPSGKGMALSVRTPSGLIPEGDHLSLEGGRTRVPTATVFICPLNLLC
ncbi:MAG: hypothetical protein A4E73_03382 [Syntrophaceae bacterium PtaU1.Bin231]|nr:MAG: hypothetical protein A4E73_03382 [Syntrophaceae bacterium PtaU1.Bin231]